MDIVERNGVKFGPSGENYSKYTGCFDSCSRSLRGHSIHFQNLDLGGTYSVYTGYAWQINVQGHSQTIRRISDFRQSCTLKTASCWTKRTKIWASVVVFCVYRVLWHLSVQCHSGSFSAFPIFRNLVSRKRLVAEQNRRKFGSGRIFSVYILHVL